MTGAFVQFSLEFNDENSSPNALTKDLLEKILWMVQNSGIEVILCDH
jgi:hypothetical protein